MRALHLQQGLLGFYKSYYFEFTKIVQIKYKSSIEDACFVFARRVYWDSVNPVFRRKKCAAFTF